MTAPVGTHGVTGGYIHEAFDGKRTICGMAIVPMMQTTMPQFGELPTCPHCRYWRGLGPLPLTEACA